jgi:hypothetical protein
MSVVAVTIASRAMNMIGGNEIASFSENSNEAKVANNLYEPLVEAALTMHRWRFASGQSVLSRLTAAPAARWDAAYQIPTNPKVLLIHGVTILDSPIEYDRYEDMIYCNASVNDTVYMDYAYYAKEANWPPYFVKAVQFELASVFAGSLARKGDLAAYYEAKAQTAYQQARWADSSSQTARNMRSRRLVDVRRG